MSGGRTTESGKQVIEPSATAARASTEKRSPCIHPETTTAPGLHAISSTTLCMRISTRAGSMERTSVSKRAVATERTRRSGQRPSIPLCDDFF